MSAPIIRRLTKSEAAAELKELESEIVGDPEEFVERAYNYDLSPTEMGLWERISELRWLIKAAGGSGR